jgi:hypothetical protein
VQVRWCFQPARAPTALKFRGGRKGQAAFAVEELFQPPVAGTALATDYLRGDAVAQFAAMTPPFEPVLVANRAFNRDAGDF